MIWILLTLLVVAGDCRKCDGVGRLPCATCERACPPPPTVEDGAERERDGLSVDPAFRPRHCSVRLRCADCGGRGTVDCPRCDVEPPLDPGEVARAADAARWLAEVEAVDRLMERELVHGASEHFRVTFDVPRYDAKEVRSRYRSHDGMHLTLARLEAFYELFCDDLGAVDSDFFGWTHVLVWSSAGDQRLASQQLTGQASTTQSKLMGAKPVVSIHYDKSFLHEEIELHQALVHQTAHCLLSNVYDGVWPGNVGGGWVDAGLAHRYEVDLFDGVRHYCYVEADTLRRFKFGRWESSVRRAVDEDEAPSVLELVGKQTAELTPEQHMFAWSVCDFLLDEHPESFPGVARGVKARQPLKDVLQESLGLSPFELDARWKEFVQRTYSPKPRRR